MRIRASVRNSRGLNSVTLRTNDHEHTLPVPPKSSGVGSSVNGGEFLFLALASCYCNDVYREAARRGIEVTDVEVSVEGDFGAEGDAASNVTYSAIVCAHASEEEIRDLMRHTDTVAEIQNTLRQGVNVSLQGVEAKSV